LLGSGLIVWREALINPAKKGFFICIEGLDKCGKTTHAHLLVKTLRRMGYKAIYTYEPTRGPIGLTIRKTLLKRKERVPPVLESVLFAADRLYHVKSEIEPSIETGVIVVADRYLYSSIAYQGATGLNIEWIREINKFAVKPDVAIYIDVPIEVLKKRWSRNRSVMEQLGIQLKVRMIYEDMVKNGLLLRINGDRSIEEVSKDILELVLNKLRL